MIEINLLPGAKKAKRSRGAGLSVGDMFTALSERVKDPYMAFAVAGLILGLAGTAFQYWNIGKRESVLAERREAALQDSTRYATVLAERRRAELQRDSVVRQFNIISTIDGERYTWAHLLDEVSEALPPYTWLKSVAQSSAVVPMTLRDSVFGEGARKIQEAMEAAMDSTAQIQLRVVGQTVDIQALTRYMRVLEASPFIQGVRLIRSDLVYVDGREVTEFTLEMDHQKPDPSAIRTVPLTVLLR